MLLEMAREEYLLARHLEGLSPRTLEEYDRKTSRFVTFVQGLGVNDIGEVTTGDIKKYLSALIGTCNMVTVGIHVKILRTYFRWLVINGILETDPMARIPKPREPNRFPYILSEAELSKLLKVARPSPRDFAVVSVLLDSGIRASELCGLTLGDLDLRDQCLIVRQGKGGKGRAVFFCDLTARALSRWLVARGDVLCDSLFVSQYNRPLTRSGLLQIINRLGKRAGIENGKRVSPHVLRASCATCYVKNGGDPHSLSRLLGHSSTRMAERYVNLVANDVREIHKRCSPVRSVING